MKYAVPVRKALGVRTVFNVLGPLTNPAGAKRQVMGVFDADLTETIARVLGALGSENAMVLHAEDGLDEISTTAATKISQFRNGRVTTRIVAPEDFGIARANMDDLLVESPAQSAEAIRRILGGDCGAARDIVLLNVAAGLSVAGRVEDTAAGIPVAAESIDSGAAKKALEMLVAASNS